MKYLVNTVGRSLSVAGDVPDDHTAEPPWMVVSLEELEDLRDKFERNPIPAIISARQARIWLVQNGISLAAVDAAIDSIPDATIRETIRVEWEYGIEIRRASEWIDAMGACLGLDQDRLDSAFREASKI